MQPSFTGRKLFKIVMGAVAIIILALGAALYNLYAPVSTMTGWQYTELVQNLPNISAVETDANGNIYALIEEKAGQGYLLSLRSGVRERVLDGLSKPDGMIPDGSDFIISEEAVNGRLIRFSPETRRSTTLATLQLAEGIAADENGNFFVVEDNDPGRMVRVNKNGNVDVLFDDLKKAEGVCIAATGSIYIAEKATGRILIVEKGIKKTFLEGLQKPGVVYCASNDELWITEDRTNAGRLLHFHNQQIDVIASHLHSPQGISFDKQDRLLLAEQGRGRILAFSRTDQIKP